MIAIYLGCSLFSCGTQQLPTSTTVSTTTATSWSRPASIVNSTAGVEVRWTDMPKIEEVTETDRQPKGVVIPTTTTAAAATTVPTKPPVAATRPSEVQPAAVTNTTTVLTPRPSVSISKVEKRSDANDDSAVQVSCVPCRASHLDWVVWEVSASFQVITIFLTLVPLFGSVNII